MILKHETDAPLLGFQVDAALRVEITAQRRAVDVYAAQEQPSPAVKIKLRYARGELGRAEGKLTETLDARKELTAAGAACNTYGVPT